MRKSAIVFAVSLVSLVSLGCLNPFANNYSSVFTDSEYRQKIASDATPRIVRTDNADKQMSKLVNSSEAWIVIGSANWVGQDWLEDQAIDQARSIGATLILVQTEKLNSQLAYLPLTTPAISTTNGSGSFSSPSGNGTYSGYSTTYGTQTTYMPYERVTMKVNAYFLAKKK
jgi:hypothetical protein